MGEGTLEAFGGPVAVVKSGLVELEGGGARP